MGAGRVVPDARSRSHLAYYVATAVIVGLLVLLCCYACYFFINKVKELSSNDSQSVIPSTCGPKKETVSYPVQPVVRDSAAAMAALCRQLPPAPAPGYSLQGDLVFPAGRSPDPRPAETGPAPRRPDAPPDKVSAPATAEQQCITLEAAR